MGSAHPHSAGATRSGLVVLLSTGAMRTLGVDVDRVAGAVGLDLASLRPDSRVDESMLYRLWDVAVELSGNHLLGLQVGKSIPVDRLETVGYCCKTSATLREIIQRMQRYTVLLSDAWAWTFEEKGDVATVALRAVPGIARHPQISVAVLAAIGTQVREAMGQHLHAKEVHFRHPAPSPEAVAALEADFGPIVFGAPDDAFVIDRALLDLVPESRDPILCALLERQIEQMLKDLPGGNPILHDTSEAIAEALHEGQVDGHIVASKLGMSARTLRRRLAEAGTSFQKLVDETRFTLAKRYLRGTQMDASEIAFELGYNNLSTFGRAFRRWAGMSPVEFRRKHG